MRRFWADLWLFLGIEWEVMMLLTTLLAAAPRLLLSILVALLRLLLLNLPRIVLRTMLRAGWPCARPVYKALKCLTERALARLPRGPGPQA